MGSGARCSARPQADGGRLQLGTQPQLADLMPPATDFVCLVGHDLARPSPFDPTWWVKLPSSTPSRRAASRTASRPRQPMRARRFLAGQRGLNAAAGLAAPSQRLNTQLAALPLLREQVHCGQDATDSLLIRRSQALPAQETPGQSTAFIDGSRDYATLGDSRGTNPDRRDDLRPGVSHGEPVDSRRPGVPSPAGPQGVRRMRSTASRHCGVAATPSSKN